MIKNKILPGSYDPIFKALMLTNKRYLVDIISGITNLDKEEVYNNLVIKNSELTVDNKEEKRKTTDLVVEVKENMINIEMNNWYYKKLYKRNEGYLYKIFNIYENEKETFIQINIDNFNKSREIIAKYEMVNVDTLERDGSIIKYRVNLALIEEKYYNDIELTKLEKELLMLRIEDKEKLEEISKGDELMKEVNDKIVIMSDERLKELEYDYIEKMKYEMRESYFDEGMEQGSISKQKEIAKKSLENSLDIEIISKITGMSKEEIENLKI